LPSIKDKKGSEKKEELLVMGKHGGTETRAREGNTADGELDCAAACTEGADLRVSGAHLDVGIRKGTESDSRRKNAKKITPASSLWTKKSY